MKKSNTEKWLSMKNYFTESNIKKGVIKKTNIQRRNIKVDNIKRRNIKVDNIERRNIMEANSKKGNIKTNKWEVPVGQEGRNTNSIYQAILVIGHCTRTAIVRRPSTPCLKKCNNLLKLRPGTVQWYATVIHKVGILSISRLPGRPYGRRGVVSCVYLRRVVLFTSEFGGANVCVCVSAYMCTFMCVHACAYMCVCLCVYLHELYAWVRTSAYVLKKKNSIWGNEKITHCLVDLR